MREATLVERLWDVLTEEHEGYRCLAIERCHSVLNASDAAEREMDLLDWGLAYGIAHGILLAEQGVGADPVELSREAHEAAREVYTRWGGSIAPRCTLSPLVDDVLVAFQDAEGPIEMAAHGVLDLTEDVEAVTRLTRRLRGLRSGIGVPEAV